MKVGDKVEIIKYGALIWSWKWIGWEKQHSNIIKEEKDIIWIDMMPNIVGEQGVICEVSDSGSIGIKPLKEYVKSYWYDESQLKLIS